MRDTTPHKRIQYIRDTFAPEDSLLKQIRTGLEKEAMPIQVGADEGKILQFLVKLINARKVAEIGALAGYSAIWMARGMSEGGHIYTVEKEKGRAENARANFAKSDVADRVTLFNGVALEILPEVAKHGPFDMVFIDADKISYPKYLDWAEANVRKGGLIVGDNTFLFESVYEDEKTAKEVHDISPTTHKAMREFNQRLADPKKYFGIMIPSKEGMTVAQKLF